MSRESSINGTSSSAVYAQMDSPRSSVNHSHVYPAFNPHAAAQDSPRSQTHTHAHSSARSGPSARHNGFAYGQPVLSHPSAYPQAVFVQPHQVAPEPSRSGWHQYAAQGVPQQSVQVMQQPQQQHSSAPPPHPQSFSMLVEAEGVPGAPGVGGDLPRGAWSDGVCSCFESVSICLTSLVLLPVRWAQTAQRLKFRSFGSALAIYGIPWLCSIVLFMLLVTHRGPHHRGDGQAASNDMHALGAATGAQQDMMVAGGDAMLPPPPQGAGDMPPPPPPGGMMPPPPPPGSDPNAHHPHPPPPPPAGAGSSSGRGPMPPPPPPGGASGMPAPPAGASGMPPPPPGPHPHPPPPAGASGAGASGMPPPPPPPAGGQGPPPPPPTDGGDMPPPPPPPSDGGDGGDAGQLNGGPNGGPSQLNADGSPSGPGGDGGHSRPPLWLILAFALPALLCNIVTIWLGTVYRGKMRARFGIDGSACGDCLLHTFCNCCAVAQEARHVDRDLGLPL